MVQYLHASAKIECQYRGLKKMRDRYLLEQEKHIIMFYHYIKKKSS